MPLFTAKKLTIKSFKIGKVVEKGATDNSSGHIYMDKAEDISSNQPTIPDVLRQEDAQALLLKAQSAGLLDENLQPTTPKSEAALLAFVIASKLHLPQQWSPFEDLWSIKELRGHYNKAIETAKSRQILTNLELLLQ